MKFLTPWEDINNILNILANDLNEYLNQQLTGVYLVGSLTYGDFDYNNSDIDLLVI